MISVSSEIEEEKYRKEFFEPSSKALTYLFDEPIENDSNILELENRVDAAEEALEKLEGAEACVYRITSLGSNYGRKTSCEGHSHGGDHDHEHSENVEMGYVEGIESITEIDNPGRIMVSWEDEHS